MGRTISSYVRGKISDFDNVKKNKKGQLRKKNKNMSKWGRHTTSDSEIDFDTFEIRSPAHTSEETQSGFEFAEWES